MKQYDDLRKRGKLAEAMRPAKQALYLARRSFPKRSAEVAQALDNLGSLYSDLNRHNPARPLLEEAVAIRANIFGVDHPKYLSSLESLAYVHMRKGLHEKARKLFNMILAHRKAKSGPNSLQVARTMVYLGELAMRTGKRLQAERLLKSGLDMLGNTSDAAEECQADLWARLGDLYRIKGDYDRAEILLARSINLQSEITGENHFDVALTLGRLALVHWHQGKKAQSKAELFRAQEIVAESCGLNSIRYAEELVLTGLVCHKEGKYWRAKVLFEMAKPILETIQPDDQKALVLVHYFLGVAYCNLHEWMAAEQALVRSLVIAEKLPRSQPSDMAPSLKALVQLYHLTGQPQRARRYQNQLERLRSINGASDADAPAKRTPE
ncbi:tetratricopeptide repeat protein [Thermodesulfobacteriota bacterium]